MKIILQGVVENGQLIFDDDFRKEYAYKMAKLEGKRFDMTLEKAIKHRSVNQQGYFHAVIVKHMVDLTGYTHEEARVETIKKFGPVLYRDGKDPILIPESLWTTIEQEEVNEKARQWFLVEHGDIVPLPNQVMI